MSAHISVQTLGSVAIDVGKRRLGPSSGRPFALLLYLTCRRGHPSARVLLQELFYPGVEPRQAAHSLRQLMYRLRQLGVPIEADADQLHVPSEYVSVDWWSIVEGSELPREDIQRIAGGVWPGYDPSFSEPFREWLDGERVDVARQVTRALGSQLTRFRRAGSWDLVDAAAQALLALDPLNEEGTLAKAEVLAVSGSKSAALGVIDSYLMEIGDQQPNLRLAPAALKRRISERLPDMIQRPLDDRLFVGREDMMRALSAAGTTMRSGVQQVLHIWGEPGIGKTRLLTEYRALCSLQGGVTHLLCCQPHDGFRPLGLLCDLVSQLLETPGSLGCDPSALRILDRLVSTHSAPPSDAPPSEATLSSIIRSLSDLISALAAESPVSIFIDDAQWADRHSLNGILGAFRGQSPRRACLILASRQRALLAGADAYSESMSSIRLSPLAEQPARELARALLTDVSRSDEQTIAQYVLEQSRGNPFFIRLLSSEVGRTGDTELLKQSVTQVLERRLEQLPPDAYRTLEVCVILGKNCTFARLESLLGVPRADLLRCIEELDERALLQVSDGCFVSSHALLSDAVVRRMSAPVNRALHAGAAELLQAEAELTPSGSLLWDCAEHWRQADRPEGAITALTMCARRLVEIGRRADAVITLMRALEFRASDATRLDIVETALNTVWIGIDWRVISELIPELKRLRQKLGRPTICHDKYEILALANTHHRGADPRVNIAQLESCASASAATDVHRSSAVMQLLMIAEWTLDKDLAQRAISAVSVSSASAPIDAACHLLFHTCFGNVDEAKHIAANLADWGLCNSQDGIFYALNAAYAQYRIASPVEAEKTLLRTLDLIRREHVSNSARVHCSLLLARLCWSTGRVAECEDWLAVIQTLHEQWPDADTDIDAGILATRLAIVQHRYEEARATIDRLRQYPRMDLDLPRLLLKSCELDLQAALGNPSCTEGELNALLATHARARNIGCQDEAVLALVRVLEQNERRDDATELLANYAKQRRDGFPLLTPLATRLTHLASTKKTGSKKVPFRDGAFLDGCRLR